MYILSLSSQGCLRCERVYNARCSGHRERHSRRRSWGADWLSSRDRLASLVDVHRNTTGNGCLVVTLEYKAVLDAAVIEEALRVGEVAVAALGAV